MSKISEKAQELGQLLINSEEYSKMEKAEEILENDEKAVEILDNFEAKQQEFANDRSNQELRTELQSLQKEMLKNEKINNYFQTQKQFGKLMDTINHEISHVLNPEQGCCSSGEGCCS